MTDADVAKPYRSIVVRSTAAKINRCAGDAAMFLGGGVFFLPFTAGYHWIDAVAGAALFGMGLIVREWGD